MPDEYTPTTVEMGGAYVRASVSEATDETGTTARDARAEFNRGLAAYEVELRERIAQDIEAEAQSIDRVPANPWVVGGLRCAARIVRGASRG